MRMTALILAVLFSLPAVVIVLRRGGATVADPAQTAAHRRLEALWAVVAARPPRRADRLLGRRVTTRAVPAALAAGPLAVVVDYVRLTKPRVISLLLFTTGAAMFVAAGGNPGWLLLMWTMIGGYLAAGGANAINQYIDRDIDDVMRRTDARPVVTGRVTPAARARLRHRRSASSARSSSGCRPTGSPPPSPCSAWRSTSASTRSG